MSRREFVGTTTKAAAVTGGLIMAPVMLGSSGRPQEAKSRISSIEHLGVLIRECGLEGERRRDGGVVPAHPNGIRLSRDRWLLIYATKGARGVDDDLSIIFQLRADSYDGRLVKEGSFIRSHNDWDLFNDGSRYVRQHGHPVAFGVPKGALIGGKPAAHGNVFVAKWRRVARILDRTRNYVEHATKHPILRQRTQGVEWVQFRLNDREDDIEIIQPASVLRQNGYEQGESFCSAKVRAMNQSFTCAVPYNGECTEWADCNHFDGDRLATLKYAFNSRLGRYEWVETGPLIESPGGLFEASLVRFRDKWVVSARKKEGKGVTWIQTDDPFRAPPRFFYPAEPASNSPLTAYGCPDGILRLFAGDASVSPNKNARDPLYCWEIDPDRGFRADHRRVIFDSVLAGLPFRKASEPKIDMCKLLSHSGRTQLIVHRVSLRASDHPYVGGAGGLVASIPIVNQEEKAACAIYYSKITYAGEIPEYWTFAPVGRT